MDIRKQKQSAKTFDGNTSRSQSDAEFWPLSGRPYFHVVIAKKKYYQMPHQMTEILPTSEVPVKIDHRGNVWDVVYRGDQTIKRFAAEGWAKFVADNKLMVDDACVFELMEGSSESCVMFKVQILRNDFPAELLAKAQGTKDNPIVF